MRLLIVQGVRVKLVGLLLIPFAFFLRSISFLVSAEDSSTGYFFIFKKE
jgi:hypothetical protein